MTGSANSRHSEQAHALDRRKLLRYLGIIPSAFAGIMLSGCEGSIPPRQVKRIPSHIVGGNGKGGRNRSRGGN